MVADVQAVREQVRTTEARYRALEQLVGNSWSAAQPPRYTSRNSAPTSIRRWLHFAHVGPHWTLEAQLAACEEQQRLHSQQIAQLTAAADRTAEWQVNWQRRHERALAQVETCMVALLARQERQEDQMAQQGRRLVELQRQDRRLRHRADDAG